MHNTNKHDYSIHQPMSDHQILEKAAEIITSKFLTSEPFADAKLTKEFLSLKLAHYEKEVFSVMLLNSQHQLIEYREMFFGSIDSANVYPREMLKVVLEVNAAAVIFAHNHPSGLPEPSVSDRRITARLTEALALIDVRVLDHVVVGKTTVSFAERGLI